MSLALSKEEKVKQLRMVLELVKGDSMPIKKWHKFVDKIELKCVEGEQLEFQVEHTFLDGMYLRKIFMPKNSFVISRIHNTKHPFLITQGSVMERTHLGTRFYNAPYRGITDPGTRRILYMIEDTVWETFHATPLTSVTEIMDSLMDNRRNPLLSDEQHFRLMNNCQKGNLLN